VDDLVNAVCILMRDGLAYTFTHRSFQEYFAALYVEKLSDEQQSKLLTKWVAQGNDEFGSGFLGLLFDLEEIRLVSNLYIPYFSNTRKGFVMAKDKFRWAFSKSYEFFRFDSEDDEKKLYVVSYENEFDVAFKMILRNLGITGFVKSEEHEKASNRVDKYFENNPSLCNREIMYEEIEKLEIFPDIKISFQFIVDRYHFLFKRLDEIKMSIKSKTDNFDELINRL
jgi:hypothetical protein